MLVRTRSAGLQEIRLATATGAAYEPSCRFSTTNGFFMSKVYAIIFIREEWFTDWQAACTCLTICFYINA